MNYGKLGEVVVEWHRDTFVSDKRSTLTARARLKRSRSPLEALLHRETLDLDRRLKAAGEQASAEQLLALTSVMSQIHDVSGTRSLPAIFGFKPDKDGPPVLSEIRFRSVVGAESLRELAPRLVRFVNTLRPKPRCDGILLAADLYSWSDQVRDAWCLQYFGVDPIGIQTWEFPQ